MFKQDDPEYAGICGSEAGQTDASGAPHSTPPPPAPIPGDATNIENVPESSGTSTREKKNRRKRAAVNPNFGKKPKKIKLDEETKVAYYTYLSRKLRFKEASGPADKNDHPPFVQIAGFHVSYDEFYESFKQRGKIDNNVMSLWTYQFNLDEAEIRKEDNNVVKKYAFLSHHWVAYS